ncbi:MAG: hypothetical protein TR69_WS6001001100 [candidate division WS6 bacterium OLB20]|uniref:Uncharacterized protein n=1 Tax=candidate division WS6 bacterium OLB20 TaxID=1617426 RepID=A0A136LZJ3_9BACT|nr:MAG: hypothetical protein TR69_WS6001001100 [candidate division WS6 bacterium OLB20]
MAASAPVTDPVIQQQILGPSTGGGITLKSIFNDPSYLKSLLIFSAIGNVLLLCGVIGALSQRSTPAPVVPTPTATATATATPIVTESPDEERARLLKCFQDCEARDFLNTLKQELQAVTYYKASGDYSDLRSTTCYGYYNEGIAPDKKYTARYFPPNCPELYTFNGASATITIGNRQYFNSSPSGSPVWETRTVTPSGQTELLDIVDLLQQQQTITSEYEQRGVSQVRILTARSEKVNEFNQLVETIVQIKVSPEYEIVYFRNFEDQAFNQNARFWDYNVPNKISSPVQSGQQ